jgi:hypothetical protein
MKTKEEVIESLVSGLSLPVLFEGCVKKAMIEDCEDFLELSSRGRML